MMNFLVAILAMVTMLSGLRATSPVPMSPWNFTQFKDHPLARQFMPEGFQIGSAGRAQAPFADPFAHRRADFKKGLAPLTPDQRRAAYGEAGHARRDERAQSRRFGDSLRPGASSPAWAGHGVGSEMEEAKEAVDLEAAAVWHQEVSYLISRRDLFLESEEQARLRDAFNLVHRYDPQGVNDGIGVLLQRIHNHVRRVLREPDGKELFLSAIFRGVPAHSPVWTYKIAGAPFFWHRVADMPFGEMRKLIVENPRLAHLCDDRGSSVLFAINYQLPDARERVRLLIPCGVDINAIGPNTGTIFERSLDRNDMTAAGILYEVAVENSIQLRLDYDFFPDDSKSIVVERFTHLHLFNEQGVQRLQRANVYFPTDEPSVGATEIVG